MHPSQASRIARMAGPVGLVLVIACSLGLFSAHGLGLSPEAENPAAARLAGLATALAMLMQSAIVPIAYVLSALGWGRLIQTAALRNPRCGAPTGARLTNRPDQAEPRAGDPASGRHAVQMSLGLAGLLVVSQLMGLAGLLTGSGGWTHVWAWAPIVLGLAALSGQVFSPTGSLRPERWPVVTPWVMVLGIPLAVGLIASASPPGWLWESEHSGYDVMSYHLQLVKEWSTPGPEGVGRLWPVEHNVYSFLPGYFEGAYLHLAAMTPTMPVMGTGHGLSGAERLVGGEGTWIISCQMLHWMMIPVFAWCVGTATKCALSGSEAESVAMERRVGDAGTIGAIVGAGMAAATPWVVVTGSMAYNEVAMLALLAGALVAALSSGLTTVQRGVIAGILVGAACSVKPTAMLLGAPMIAAVLAATIPLRDWRRLALAGAIAGVGVMLPWLIRNELAAGNPVFPFASSWLGAGHWSEAQHATYSVNHGPVGGAAERFGLLFSDARGLLHRQWAMMPLVGAVGIVGVALMRSTGLVGSSRRRACRVCLALAAGMAIQLLAWMFATHLQSRFLITLAAPMSVCTGLAAAMAIEVSQRRAAAVYFHVLVRFGLGAMVVMTGCWTAMLWWSQQRSEPNALLLGAAGALTGAFAADSIAATPRDERAGAVLARASPEMLVNVLTLPELVGTPEEVSIDRPRVYLLGDAGALYFFGATGGPEARVIYHTTWDRSPLGQAGEPGVWRDELLRNKIGFVLVNFSELARLIRKDRYYDARVRLEDIDAWLRSDELELVKGWENQNRALFRIKPAPIPSSALNRGESSP